MTFTPSALPFVPHPLLCNPHLMTIVPAFVPRHVGGSFKQCAQMRLFAVDGDTKILTYCHFQKDRLNCPTLVVVHGLEGSSESSHVISLCAKAFAAGFNAVRLNMRNCGGSMHLTPTLYNGGLSGDLLSVVEQLQAEGDKQIFAAGFSLGGNVVLKAAGELGAGHRDLIAAVATVSPAIDLDLAVQAIERSENRLYERWFLRTLKQKIVEKARLFPGQFNLEALAKVDTLRGFDDLFTAPSGGYRGAAQYYKEASALRVLKSIKIESLIIAAQDDPLVPFAMFELEPMQNAHIHLLATQHGGHAAFVQKKKEPQLDRFWAENRMLEFFIALSREDKRRS